MKHLKNVIVMLLVVAMVLSCIGTAFAADKATVDSVADAKKTEASEKKLGFKSETFALENTYKYAEDETVRAIVVLEGAPEADVATRGSKQALAQRAKLQAEQQAVRAAMADIDFTVEHEFTAVLNGFSCDVAYGKLDAIAAIDGVKAVYIANHYDVPTIEKPDTAFSGIMTGNTMMKDLYGVSGQGMVIAVLDTGTRTTHEVFQVYDEEYMTENASLTEESVTAAELGRGTYLNVKIPFAYDYADQDNDVSDTNGHGTHVAGTALGYKVAEDGAIEFSGAAPAAQLVAMKIFQDNQPGTTSDIYFDALDDAYKLGVDVVNMSIGSQNGFTYDTSLETEEFGNIYERLTNAGIVLCISAGNEASMAENATQGFIGPEYTDYGVVGTPSTYNGPVSIASVENAAYPAYVVKVGEDAMAFQDSSADTNADGLWLATFGGKTYEYVTGLGIGQEADYEGKDVTGKIAVVSRGETTFEEKVTLAANKGAIGCVVVNNEPGIISMQIENFAVPAISLQVDAMSILENAEKKELYTPTGLEITENANAWMMSDFSSWGTTPELTMKPTITSVGGNVYSSVNTGDGDYDVYSGTSMAAPNAAGTFANILCLLKSEGVESKTERAATAKQLLESTALPLFDADDFLFSVRKQGAGLANSVLAADVYNNGAYITNPLAELGDDPAKTGKYSFDVTLKNETDKDVTYLADFIAMHDYIEDIGDDENPTFANTLLTDYFVEAQMQLTGAEKVPCYLEKYTDCNPDYWYHEYIDYVVSEGLMNGVAETRFSPDGTLNRAMVVTVLYREAGSPKVDSGSTFTDVPSGEWYSDAVAWAQQNKIVDGVTPTTFAPLKEITREQIATILWRIAGSPVLEADFSAFNDADKISPYAANAMAWAVNTGVLQGDKNLLNPLGKATRAQYAAILTRILQGEYDCTAECVKIPANSEKTVKVEITLSKAEKAYLDEMFENGTFVEGYVVFGNEDSEAHATFLAFYGDWTKAPLMEDIDFRDAAEVDIWLNTTVADSSGATYADLGYTYADLLPLITDINGAYLYNYGLNKLYAYAGDNILDYVDYDEAHIAFSTVKYDGSYAYANSLAMLPNLVRNAENLTVTIADKTTGEVYFAESDEFVPKSAFDEEGGYWEGYTAYVWDGTKEDGTYVPSGTVVTVTYDAVMPYKDTEKKDIWSFEATVDYTAPVIEDISYDFEAKTLTVTASDENYLAAIYLADTSYNVLDAQSFSSNKKGESFTATFDVSELGMTSVLVTALDYATNEQEESYAFDLGTATITYITPDGTTAEEANIGETYAMADCTAAYEGYEFIAWVPEEYENSDGNDIVEFYDAYEEITVAGDMTLYALYGKGEWVEAETPDYYIPEVYTANFEGDWCFGGWNLDEDYYYLPLQPIVMGKNGEALDAIEDLGAEHSAEYLDFLVDNLDICFHVAKDGDSYTVQNADGKYLANANGAIAFVDTVDDTAKWTFAAGEDSNVYVFNVADPDIFLAYNDMTGAFELMEEALLYGYNMSDLYPLRLYVCETSYFDAEYYTTSPVTE